MTMINYPQRLVLASIAVLILSVIPLSLVHAATENTTKNGIAMSPVKKNYDFEAGTTTRDTVKITNVGTITYTFKLYAEPYSVKNETYETDFLTVKKNTDLPKWVSFDKSSYVLSPGQSVEAPYALAVPTSATPGGHYGIIFAETQPQDGANESASLVGRSRVGAPIFANVKGDYVQGGKFLGIRIPVLQFKSPVKSELDVENTGNSHFSVETVFAVSDLFGNRKFTNATQSELLPQSIRKIELKWDKSPGFGFYQVTASAKFLDKETTKTSYVLMAPLAFYMIFIIGLLVAIIVFVAKRR